MLVRDLPTPSLVVDFEKMTRNIARVADHAEALDVFMRPHLKTPKCVEIARLLTARRAKGITVSTLAEAAYFLRAGYEDILYTTPLAPQKVADLASLAAAGGRIVGVVDCPDAVERVRAAAAQVGAPTHLLVEIDVDGYRSGIDPEDPQLLQMIDVVADDTYLRFEGLLAYAGASYHLPKNQREGLANQHCAALGRARTALEERGHPSKIRSFGSTPAFMQARSMPGVTEVRGGIYVFQDLFQAGIGACSIDDIALSVATRVVSEQPRRNRFFIDAGGLALSKDRSTAGTSFDARYGLVATEDGDLIEELIVGAVHQEIGVVESRDGSPIDMRRYRVGTPLRILPNHADMTAAAYDHYFVLDRGRISDRWRRQNGWQIADIDA